MELSDRMKDYEKCFDYQIPKKSALILRIDGRSFHTFTKHCDKPFDIHLINSLVLAARKTAEDMSGFQIGYHQSDEISFFLKDYSNIETQPWFDNRLNKLLSISSSLMTSNFNRIYSYEKDANFDSRVFVLPKEEVSNYFLWRAKDWKRNSLSMYCRKFFSHKELHHKNQNDMHEMLSKIDKNWENNLVPQLRNGTFFDKNGAIHTEILPNFKDIDQMISKWI